MDEMIIQTEGLTRNFKNVHAVDGLSLAVPYGIVFGFLGPNGSGKTTTIHLLLGLLEPTAGRASVLGYDIMTQADKIRNNTGVLLEFSGIYERLSAIDNLDFYGRIWHMSEQERRTRIKELLTHMDLWDRRNDVVGKWSKGMKQKLAVARALFHRPSLLFLDEPTSGLDTIAAASLREDIASLVAREKVTVFLTTHNLMEAEKLCGKIGVINHGKLIALGQPDELRMIAGNPKIEITGKGFTDTLIASLRSMNEVSTVELKRDRIIITLQNNIDTSRIVNHIVCLGGEIEEVHKSKASLEEAFLSLVDEE